MNNEKNKDEKHKVHKDINYKISLQLNEITNQVQIKVDGVKKIDKLFLRMNKRGSGTFEVEIKPIFGVFDEINRALAGLGKIKMDDYKGNGK